MSETSSPAALRDGFQAMIYAAALRDLLAEPGNLEAIDEIFEADLVRDCVEVIGGQQNVIVLRDASGFDVLLTVTCEEITADRTAAIDAARAAREEEDDDEDEDEDEDEDPGHGAGGR
jgi:enhancing lycopene biosynthesis protein 2